MAIINYNKACSANKPGNAFLAFIEKSNITSFTVVAEEISAVTVVLSKTFHEFKTDIDTIQFTSEGTGASAFFQNNKIVAKFSKLSKELITAKQALVDAVACGAYAIYVDNNNQAWLVGYNEKEGNRRPLNKITANFDTGVKISDEGMGAYTITIEGGTSYDIVPFDAATTAAIIDGTAAFITFNS